MSKVTIGEITDSCLGKMLDAAKNKGEYTPYLANANVRWGAFDLSDLPQMRFEVQEQERYGLRYGDLVMCEGGEPVRCAIWRDQIPEMKIQKALHRIRVHEGVDVNWLYYWFLAYGQRHLLDRFFIETTIKHLPGDRLKEIELDLPSFEEQKGIGEVLSSLDAKIELNTRLCAELESMARTLYDYWFVQFDFPDEHSRPYRSSGGEMVWCWELGREVPKGWRIGTLSDLVTIQKDGFDPTTYGNETVEHYSIPAFDEGRYPSFETADTILSGKYTVPLSSILFSKLNPQFKRIWDPPCLSDVRACSTEFMVYTPIDEALRPFIYATLNSDAFYRFTVQIASSSTGSRKRLDPDATMKYSVIMPDKRVIQEFCAQIKPTLEKAKKLQIENHELTKLRDWLLPMLMNGQAHVER